MPSLATQPGSPEKTGRPPLHLEQRLKLLLHLQAVRAAGQGGRMCKGACMSRADHTMPSVQQLQSAKPAKLH